MLGVEKSKEKKWKVDQKFTNMSHIRPYKYWGGAFPEFDDNWNMWSQSILMKNNLVCLNWEAVPITDFLELDHRALAKKENMKRALALYLNKPMCNHIKFSH
jgi:hypothetical protein